MSLFNDQDDFSVDRFNLEVEAERNSALMRKYSKLFAIASAQCKDEKRKLEFTEVEQAEIIRSNKEAYGIDKATDKVVFALAKNEEAYKSQFNRYIIAFRKEQDLKGAVDSIYQRGMMIKILAELWLNKYYAVPVVSRSSQLKKINIDDGTEDLVGYGAVEKLGNEDDIPY